MIFSFVFFLIFLLLAGINKDIVIPNHVEVIEDDRLLKPGFKFKDWELIGIPNIIIVGRKANENIVEFKDRTTNEKVEMTSQEAIKKVIELVKNIK